MEFRTCPLPWCVHTIYHDLLGANIPVLSIRIHYTHRRDPGQNEPERWDKRLYSAYHWKALPCRPIAMMLFKTWDYIPLVLALQFASDLKLGHHMKIPHRLMFWCHLVAMVALALFSPQFRLGSSPTLRTFALPTSETASLVHQLRYSVSLRSS